MELETHTYTIYTIHIYVTQSILYTFMCTSMDCVIMSNYIIQSMVVT